MGWAYCGRIRAWTPPTEEWPKGHLTPREIGYGIEATCDARGCENVITRGLDAVCGEMHHEPFDDEPGCGRYYCDSHRRWRCSHRGRYAWGKTACQPMKVDATGEVYCACLTGHPIQWPDDD